MIRMKTLEIDTFCYVVKNIFGYIHFVPPKYVNICKVMMYLFHSVLSHYRAIIIIDLYKSIALL